MVKYIKIRKNWALFLFNVHADKLQMCLLNIYFYSFTKKLAKLIIEWERYRYLGVILYAERQKVSDSRSYNENSLQKMGLCILCLNKLR